MCRTATTAAATRAATRGLYGRRPPEEAPQPADLALLTRPADLDRAPSPRVPGSEPPRCGSGPVECRRDLVADEGRAGEARPHDDEAFPRAAVSGRGAGPYDLRAAAVAER